MKKLFLHIGAGKTGSSALQLWFVQNHLNLKKNNITYPLFNIKIKNKYQITSGNGVHFIHIMKDSLKSLKLFFNEFKHNKNHLFLSSEAFQNLTEKELILIKKTALDHNYETHIILYIRDIYDMLYSSYQQLIKRHHYTFSFEHLAMNIQNLQQFDVLYKYEKVFQKIEVIHYDSFLEKGIEKPLCNILKIDPTLLEPLSKDKVNRSLDIFETELLKNINIIYTKITNNTNDNFCTTLSDMLIYKNPEKETEIYYNEKIILHIRKKFQKDLNHINHRYLKKDELTIFQKKNKILLQEIPLIKDEFLLIIKSIINFLIQEKKFIIKEHNKIDIIGILFNEGVKRETTNIQEAKKIMEAAQILRPEGILIQNALKKYNKLL